MAKELTDARIILAEKDITTFHNQIKIEELIDELNSTTFGIGNRTRQPGMFEGRITGGGFMEWDTGLAPPNDTSIGQFMQSKIALIDQPASVAEARGAFGKHVFFSKFMSLEFSPLQGAVTDLAEFTLNLTQTGAPPIVDGLVAEPGTTVRTTTFSTTPIELRAALSGEKIWAIAHCLQADGTTPSATIVVESDALVGFGSPTTIINTFTAFTAKGAQLRSANGPNADTFYRITVTISGGSPQFKLFVGIGII